MEENETTPNESIAADLSGEVEVIESTNESAMGEDGWMRLAPFGDFAATGVWRAPGGGARKTVPVVQRIDRESATAIVESFNSFGGRLLRFVRGLPILNGHPNSPTRGDEYPDKRELGLVTKMEVRDDGLYALPAFNGAGEEVMKTTKGLAPSAHFSARAVVKEGDQLVMRPNRVISVGLTPRPNLPVESLNSKDEQTAQATEAIPEMKHDVLIAALKKYGVEIFNSAEKPATEAEILAGLDSLGAKAVNTVVVEAEILNERTRATEATQKADAAAAAIEAQRLETLNERNGRIEDVLDLAQETGRITQAERSQWHPRLKTNFAGEREAILKLDRKVRVDTKLSAEDRKASQSAAGDPVKLRAIAGEKWEAHPLRKTDSSRAWIESYNEAVRENPSLAPMP